MGDSLRHNVNNHLKYVLATQAIEGISPSPEANMLCEEIVVGHITADASIEKIKQKYGITGSNETMTNDKKIDRAAAYIFKNYRPALRKTIPNFV